MGWGSGMLKMLISESGSGMLKILISESGLYNLRAMNLLHDIDKLK
jgi:hypothetical protein